MKNMKRGVAVLLLLLTLTLPANVFANETANAVAEKGNTIYESENGGNIYEVEKKELEKMLKDELFQESNTEIPYQEVPKISDDKKEDATKPNNKAKTPLVEGGNTNAVNPLATKENKARGTVIENVDSNGDDITPAPKINAEEQTNPVDVRQFLTFQTKSGKTMHLIVDHSSNQSNVQLLTEVGEQDLLNMIESDDKAPLVVQEEPKKVESTEEEPKVEVEKKEEEKGGIGTYLLVILVVVGVVGAGYYLKVVKAKEDKVLEGFEEDDDYYDESDDEYYEEGSDGDESVSDEDDDLL